MKIFAGLFLTCIIMHYLGASFIAASFNPADMTVDNKIGACISLICWTVCVGVISAMIVDMSKHNAR